jgi:hypothetical protein
MIFSFVCRTSVSADARFLERTAGVLYVVTFIYLSDKKVFTNVGCSGKQDQWRSLILVVIR